VKNTALKAAAKSLHTCIHDYNPSRCVPCNGKNVCIHHTLGWNCNKGCNVVCKHKYKIYLCDICNPKDNEGIAKDNEGIAKDNEGIAKDNGGIRKKKRKKVTEEDVDRLEPYVTKEEYVKYLHHCLYVAKNTNREIRIIRYHCDKEYEVVFGLYLYPEEGNEGIAKDAMRISCETTEGWEESLVSDITFDTIIAKHTEVMYGAVGSLPEHHFHFGLDLLRWVFGQRKELYVIPLLQRTVLQAINTLEPFVNHTRIPYVEILENHGLLVNKTTYVEKEISLDVLRYMADIGIITPSYIDGNGLPTPELMSICTTDWYMTVIHKYISTISL
jgi:hypothetical protein